MLKTKVILLVVVPLVALCLSAVPARADMYNLTGPTGPVVGGVAGVNAVEINGAWFLNVLEAEASTGSGVIHSFVRIDGNGNENGPGEERGVEQGYNTDYRPVQFDENTSPTFTRSLLLSAVPIVTLSHGTPGTLYREFLLDINQTNNNPLLALDDIEIFQGSAGNVTGYDTTEHDLGPLGIKRYDLNSHTAPPGGTFDNWILLNYALDTGSGGGDMFAYLPDSLFDPANGAYVYLYSHVGASGAGLYPNNDGYEEWAVRTPTETTVVPVPAALLLGMLGLGAAGLKLRKFA